MRTDTLDVISSENMPVATFQTWLADPAIPFLPETVAVGWSGGADSTALLLALQASGRRVHAWHVDHGWRDSSAHEAERLAEQAAQWGISFISARLQSVPGDRREAAARTGRYAQFQQWSKTFGLTTLCLAHQRDDQAETVCMRLLQGAGPGGCRGMWFERQMGALRIVRPLLHIPGLQLRQALRRAGIGWFEDPSNAHMHLWRNKIRHQLFPAISQYGVAPDALFLRWQQQAAHLTDRLDSEAHALLDSLDQTACGMRLPWVAWKDCSAPVRARALQACMLQLLGEGVTPGRRHIELVEAWTNKSGRGGLDLSRCRLYRERDYLHLRPVTAALAVKR